MTEEPDDPISAIFPEFRRLLKSRPDIRAAFETVMLEVAREAYAEGREQGRRDTERRALH